jgi:thioredoxin 1
VPKVGVKQDQNFKNKVKMNKIIFSAILLITALGSGCSQQNKQNAGAVIHLTNDQFKTMVFNYEVNKEWKYLGNKPAIIDFYADWCGPCRMMSPRLEEIAKEYAGKLIVYKVDTDKEQQLSASLGIQSLPTLIFIPQNGQPQVSMGAIPKESLVKAIHEVLRIE